jgi:excisionase family DNA binding protein
MLTLTEAADQLGLAASTLRHQVQAGRLRARLVGKTYVVSGREVERYRREHLGRPGRPTHRRAPPFGP